MIWYIFSLSVAGSTTCTRLSSPPGGAVTFSSSSLSSGTIATYTCYSGYSLVGSSSRICLSSGSWNGSQPYCQRQGVWGMSYVVGFCWLMFSIHFSYTQEVYKYIGCRSLKV